MSNFNSLFRAIKHEAEKRGWEVVWSDVVEDIYIVQFKDAKSPPPSLSIHIRDGVGTDDKVGG